MLKNVRGSVRCLVLGATLAGSLLVTTRAGFAATITTITPGTLQVCLYAGFKPFAWKDGNVWKGWDVDYLTAFAKANHLAFKVVEEPAFNDIWLRPGKNECDIAGTGISDTQDRRKATGSAGQWSATYYTVVRAFLVRTADKD
jgi:ABC-type amino acid transport substrate-binding protein